MREDDPRSLNDDYVRTFTVSSAPPPPSNARGTGEETDFEITIRNVGTVTSFLFRYPVRSGLEVPLRGFGGTFGIDIPEAISHEKKANDDNDRKAPVPFVAGGIGITPVLAQLPELEERGLLQREHGGFRLFWAVHVKDLGLAVDTLETFPGLKRVTRVFVSGTGLAKSRNGTAAEEKAIERLRGMIDSVGGGLVKRRLSRDDLLTQVLGLREVERWYLCAGKPLRKEVVSWLEGRKVVYEDFDY